MELSSIIWNLFFVIFLVLLNGFFVASEFALVKVRSTRIAQLIEEGNKKAKNVQHILKHLDAYLSATQLGITLASLGLGWIGEPVLARLLEPLFTLINLPATGIHILSFTIAFSIITVLHIVIGEMAPKTLAIQKSESISLWISKPLHWFFVLFRPTIWLLNGTANRILKWFNVDLVAEYQQAHTEEEIRMLMKHSHRNGMIDNTELSLFDNIFEFTDRIGREVMVPRVNIICVFLGETAEDNIAIIRNSHYTRFPLCGKDKDDVLGFIHIRDLYERMIRNEEIDFKEMSRPVVLVPESMEIKDVLTTLQKNRTEMAIVVDEYGGTSGLVTVEDIIEEIVGEIQDEFDNEQLPLVQKKGEEYIIDAQLLIEEVNKLLNTDIEDEDNDTIGGWIFSQLQEIPKKGSSAIFDKYMFVVQEMNHRRVLRLLIKPYNPDVITESETLSDLN